MSDHEDIPKRIRGRSRERVLIAIPPWKFSNAPPSDLYWKTDEGRAHLYKFQTMISKMWRIQKNRYFQEHPPPLEWTDWVQRHMMRW